MHMNNIIIYNIIIYVVKLHYRFVWSSLTTIQLIGCNSQNITYHFHMECLQALSVESSIQVGCKHIENKINIKRSNWEGGGGQVGRYSWGLYTVEQKAPIISACSIVA